MLALENALSQELIPGKREISRWQLVGYIHDMTVSEQALTLAHTRSVVEPLMEGSMFTAGFRHAVRDFFYQGT